MVKIEFDRIAETLKNISRPKRRADGKRYAGTRSTSISRENIYMHRVTHLSHCDLMRFPVETSAHFDRMCEQVGRRNREEMTVLRAILPQHRWGSIRPPLYLEQPPRIEELCTCKALAAPERCLLYTKRNIITHAGDTFYAESTMVAAGNGSHTVDYIGANGRMVLSTSAFSPSPSKTTDAGDLSNTGTVRKAFDTGSNYPQTNDPDANNPGTVDTDILTWRTSWTIAEAIGTNLAACIALSTTTFGSGSDPLLMAADVNIVKGASDTLTTYVNHEHLGV